MLSKDLLLARLTSGLDDGLAMLAREVDDLRAHVLVTWLNKCTGVEVVRADILEGCECVDFFQSSLHFLKLMR